VRVVGGWEGFTGRFTAMTAEGLGPIQNGAHLTIKTLKPGPATTQEPTRRTDEFTFLILDAAAAKGLADWLNAVADELDER
jgi:hypothetical protein